MRNRQHQSVSWRTISILAGCALLLSAACRRERCHDTGSPVPGNGVQIALRDAAGRNLLDTSLQRYHADSIRFSGSGRSDDLSSWAEANGYDSNARILIPHFYPLDCYDVLEEGTGIWGLVFIHLDSADTDTVIVERLQSDVFTYRYNGQSVGTRSAFDRQRVLEIDVRK